MKDQAIREQFRPLIGVKLARFWFVEKAMKNMLIPIY